MEFALFAYVTLSDLDLDLDLGVLTVRADRCDGDQVWTNCGSQTTRTCSDPNPDTSQDACVPRCHCPGDRPVWDDDRQMCINADECVAYWK